MRIVIALGGNGLSQRGDSPDADVQFEYIRRAATVLAPLAAAHEMVICHGNGPQNGLLSLESQTDPALSRSHTLDALGAQHQGMVGYWLAQGLRNAGVTQPVVGLVTQVTVDPADPAFANPTTFIGPGYPQAWARQLAAQHTWTVGRDGDQWRRVVPSPAPRRVVERDAIAFLLASGAMVICGGGGGAPVTENSGGTLAGVQAVVDKDRTAALLAVGVNADRLLILTDVAAVMRDFNTPRASPIRHLDLMTAAHLRLPIQSMRPKVDACRQFVAATGEPAAIGALSDVPDILAGRAGTTIADTVLLPPRPRPDARSPARTTFP